MQIYWSSMIAELILGLLWLWRYPHSCWVKVSEDLTVNHASRGKQGMAGWREEPAQVSTALAAARWGGRSPHASAVSVALDKRAEGHLGETLCSSASRTTSSTQSGGATSPVQPLGPYPIHFAAPDSLNFALVIGYI